jgi:hypothetical protein
VRPKILNAVELMALELPEPRWAVEELIPEGLTILAGRPKLGKSWLALGVGIAVASGGRALGRIPVTAGDVLYLALEDSPRRLKERLGLLLDGDAPSSRLSVSRQWPRGADGVVEVEQWLRDHPDTRLVVIDTLAKFRAKTKTGSRGYDDDYSDLEPLQELATRYHLAIVVVAHVRKLPAEDWVDTLSGTLGLAAAADGLVGLFRNRGASEAVLKVTGRDLEERELGLRFDDLCTWTLLGDAAVTVELSAERKAILRLLEESGPLGPVAVAARLRKNPNTTKHTMRAMATAGQLSVDGGTYAPVIRMAHVAQWPGGDYAGHAGHEGQAGPKGYKGHKGYLYKEEGDPGPDTRLTREEP